MSGETSLFSLARSKLYLSASGKDKSTSLHRWVLLKNSITASNPATPSPTLDSSPSHEDEQGIADEDGDSFMFPDVGKFVQGPTAESNNSEAQWLDSLLESLGDDEDYDDTHSLSVDEDEDQLLSPLPSPMSSSDDLTSFYPPLLYPPLSVPYSVPYSPPHYSSIPLPTDHPLPYYDEDDLEEELSVPDAIEDTSDDESDVPATPSLGRSRSSVLLAEDPGSLPIERSRLRDSQPYIYIDSDDSYFYPFDPLPFPHDRFSSYDTYQEC